MGKWNLKTRIEPVEGGDFAKTCDPVLNPGMYQAELIEIVDCQVGVFQQPGVFQDGIRFVFVGEVGGQAFTITRDVTPKFAATGRKSNLYMIARAINKGADLPKAMAGDLEAVEELLTSGIGKTFSITLSLDTSAKGTEYNKWVGIEPVAQAGVRAPAQSEDPGPGDESAPEEEEDDIPF